MSAVATLADVVAAEAGWPPADLPHSTYGMIARAAALHPQAPALTYFPQARTYQSARTWDYRAFMARVTQAANAFFALGVRATDVIAVILPNLPETHFVYWGGEAAGIVAMINPLLEPGAIADLVKSVRAKVLVTLAPTPGTDIWSKIQPVLPVLDTVEHLVLVSAAPSPCGEAEDLAAMVPAPIRLHHFTPALDAQDDAALVSQRVIAASDHASYFCTGGTTGLPKIAMRSHGSEVANAWSAARFLGRAPASARRYFAACRCSTSTP